MFQAISCVRTLLSALEVFEPSYSDAQRSFRVLHGLHGLHVYANEFWTEHLLLFAQGKALCDAEKAASLINLSDNLCARLAIAVREKEVEADADEFSDERLSLFVDYPTIYATVKRQLVSRSEALATGSRTSTYCSWYLRFL
jgi:hypothetical protein